MTVRISAIEFIALADTIDKMTFGERLQVLVADQIEITLNTDKNGVHCSLSGKIKKFED